MRVSLEMEEYVSSYAIFTGLRIIELFEIGMSYVYFCTNE